MGGAYTLKATSGYLMTAAPSGQASVELEDCVRDRPGHPDHLLAKTGFCEGHAYCRLRTAGFVFAAQKPNTQPLYQCYSDADRSHFAANQPGCDGEGRKETLLGYDRSDCVNAFVGIRVGVNGPQSAAARNFPFARTL